jgi:hypothetical protein
MCQNCFKIKIYAFQYHELLFLKLIKKVYA